jgi:hypothetical protein
MLFSGRKWIWLPCLASARYSLTRAARYWCLVLGCLLGSCGFEVDATRVVWVFGILHDAVVVGECLKSELELNSVTREVAVKQSRTEEFLKRAKLALLILMI